MLSLQALLVFFFLSLSSAQNICAFYSTKGPTVVSFDSRGNVIYNVYAQNGFSSMKSFSPTFPPKNETSLASIGYSTSTSIYAWQFFKCSYASGNCVNYGGSIISGNVNVPIKPGTGLAASVLSNDLGYRATYEDIHGSVRQLGYANNTQGVVSPWADGTLIGNMTSNNGSLSTTWILSANATTPAQQTIYQIAENQRHKLGLQFLLSRIFQIADVSNAPTAATTAINASGFSSSVFYVSDGKFTKAKITGYNWMPYTIAQPVVVSNTSTNLTAPLSTFVKDTKDVTIGASVGSVAGFLIVAGLCWLIYRNRWAPIVTKEESIREWAQSVRGFVGKAELDGHPAEKFELDHDPECQVLHQLQLYRMYELKGEIPVELQNTETRRSELDHTLCKCELDASVVHELPTVLEKEESIAESSKEVVSTKVLPSCSWAILKRQVEDVEIGSTKGEN